ncbi:Chromatin structure-remodeling complex protein rsc9 [Coelomomyces lativittatus]|nr:Chromatin structure-remodeling complex protein rsc9 [Coelomomyces lativittatus]KAJ1511747.1 Chromatin structure-remodeling complex protein rsc9 [Coelomomyces lativittatus]KAJ1517905.1 Chromatin structure-remodeling complex protein rsc9 [Coelomomyces lativittatus]
MAMTMNMNNMAMTSTSLSTSTASNSISTAANATATTIPLTHSYKVEDNEFTQGGFENRILLALKSNLPNEIDWALAKLCSISYTNDRFHLQSIPGLLEALMHICFTFAEQCSSDLNDLVVSKEDLVHQTRATLILHALRNFSFVQTNFRYLTSARGFLLQMLTLPDLGKTLELKLMALDILENVAFMLKLEPNPQDIALLSHLHSLVLHSDRAFVLGSLRTLCRLALLEANEPMFLTHLPIQLVHHVCQWLPLLHVDEELVHRALDYLYQFTLMSPGLTNQIAEALTPTQLQLIFLCVGYKCPSSRALEPNDPASFMHLRLQQWLTKPSPSFTQDMQKTYLWIQNFVEPDPQASVSKSYLKFIFETHPHPCPISFTTFLEWIPQVCPVHVFPDHLVGFRIKKSMDDHFSCSWTHCTFQSTTLAHLLDHVLRDHVPTTTTCQWGHGHCQWPLSEQHVRTHHFAYPKPIESMPVYHHIHLETTTDPIGVPYTACLVLRNLAKASNASSLFSLIYDDLVLASSKYPRLTKYLMWPLHELQFSSAS